MKNSEMNIELAVRYITGSASGKERESFELWLNMSLDHKQQYEAFRKYWIIADSSYDNYAPNLNAGWTKVSRETVHKKVVPFRQKSVSFQIIKIAAILLLLLAGGYGVRHVMIKVGMPEGQLFVYQTDNTTKKFILNDGSAIWLNKHSEIRIPGNFNRINRSVSIEGEAYFEVAHNAKVPFIISTGNTVIKVMGTAFNVRAIKSDTKVKVTVYSGHVAFYLANEPSKITHLKTGDKGVFIIGTNNITKENSRNSNDLAWKTGTLIFKDATLDELCDALSDYFNTEVKADRRVGDIKKFTGNFHKASLSEILEIVELTLDVEFVKSGNKIIAKP